MAKQIESEIIKILTELLQAITYRRKMPSTWQSVPSERLVGWHAAMRHLQSLGILDFEIIDTHNRPYVVRMTPEEEYIDLKYRYTSFDAEKTQQLCASYNISLPGVPRGETGVIYADPKDEIALLQVSNDMTSIHSPYSRRVAEISYKRDAIELVVNEDTYAITLRAGQVKDIVSVAANNDYIDSTVSKGTIEKVIGHSISSPLTTVLKDSIFTNELSDFAVIEPQHITIYSSGTVLEQAVISLKHKPNVKPVKRKRVL